jgi:endonuclease-8
VGSQVRSLLLVRGVSRTDGLVGSKIVGVEARGKNLLVHFAKPHDTDSNAREADSNEGEAAAQSKRALGRKSDEWSFHVHLKMNGRVRLYGLGTAPRVAMASASAVLETAAHRLVVYQAPIARLLRTSDLRGDFHLRGLGPDLLGPSFDLAESCARLAAKASVPLGEAIMDQGVVAGIGNVWKSELCFTLRLDPFAPVGRFAADELSGLLSLARTQLLDTVHGPKRMLPDPFEPRAQRKARLDRRQGEGVLSVYGRQGEPCYDCGATIAMQRQGELLRSTYYCPSCQPARGEA